MVFYLECVCVFSHLLVSNSATPWAVAHQAPLPVEFCRSGLPFPPPGDPPNPENETAFLALAEDLPLTEPLFYSESNMQSLYSNPLLSATFCMMLMLFEGSLQAFHMNS